MILIISVMCFFYFHMMYLYSNINASSGIVALLVGIGNVFLDPLDIRSKFMRVLALLLILGGLMIMMGIFFFYTSSRLLPTWYYYKNKNIRIHVYLYWFINNL